jgi:hypothetical protein
MSATATKLPLGDLVPVSAEEHARDGLLPSWKFFHAPPGLRCDLCGIRPAAYIAAPWRLRCAKHARDF